MGFSKKLTLNFCSFARNSVRRKPVRQILIITLAICHFAKIDSRPIDRAPPAPEGADNSELTSAMMYLMKYGYMEMNHGKSAPLLSQDGLKKYIVEFQKFAGLNQTGELDEETTKMMHMPRCGVKDIIGKNDERESRRKKRYALQGSRWRVKNITYKISKYPSSQKMSPADVDSELKRALDVWAEYTDLTFEKKTSGQVHIDIRFEVGEHGDGDPFDGSGGTLAHAFFPVYGGDAHFDDAETWTMNSYSGTNLLQTAAHEFGHSLGLSHSDSHAALMAPFYRGFETKPRLNEDDIKAIQALYGTKSDQEDNNVITEPNAPSIPNPVPDNSVSQTDEDNQLCRDSSFDAAVTLNDGDTYVFRFSQYWKLTEESVAPGYPRSIAQDWDGLPGNIDAAFTWTNGKTYFFRGTQYWRFSGKKMDEGYPKPIRSGFDGIPSFIDAAFVWSGNGKIYFFKDDKYYRFDPEKRPPVSSGYPKPISNWDGIPNKLDDALQYSNGYTYFFKDGKYWRFNDKKFQVDDADPSFPRPVSYWWFGCKSSPKGRTPKRNKSFGGGKNFFGDRIYPNVVETDSGLGPRIFSGHKNDFGGWKNNSWTKFFTKLKNLFS